MKIKTLLIAASIALTTACGNLSDVNSDGKIHDPVWPDVEKSTFDHSKAPATRLNITSLNMVETGMNKDQLFVLIGRPHFAEGLYGVREWDYAMKDGDSWCQVKIGFDKHGNVGYILRKPEGCLTK